MNEKINIEEQVNENVAASQENENANETIEILAERIKSLEAQLAEASSDKDRYWKYYMREADKVKVLHAIYKTGLSGDEIMSARQFAEKIVNSI